MKHDCIVRVMDIEYHPNGTVAAHTLYVKDIEDFYDVLDWIDLNGYVEQKVLIEDYDLIILVKKRRG